MSHVRNACSVARQDGGSIEDVYKSFCMDVTAREVAYGVVEWVKCDTLMV